MLLILELLCFPVGAGVAFAGFFFDAPLFLFVGVCIAAIPLIHGLLKALVLVSQRWREKQTANSLIAQLEAQPTESLKERDSLKSKISSLRDQWEEAERRRETENSRTAELRANLTEGLKERDSLKSEISSLREQREKLRGAVKELGERILEDNTAFLEDAMTANNLATSKRKMDRVIEFLGKQDVSVTAEGQARIGDKLQKRFEEVLRKEYARQEQARIKAQIREEQRLEAEHQRELQKIENDQIAIERALQKALQKTQDEHATEVERLREQLAEAQQRLERAKSQAELTKAGFIYVISNIGSFGQEVFKIGMTRRLEPLHRVRELSDASVPFPFDVHMMISSTDAPTLESALHRALEERRINRVNPRKEFFRADLDMISGLVERHHGKVDYVADPEALEYRESLAMTDDDFKYALRQ